MGAMLYLATYTRDENGVLRLSGVTGTKAPGYGVQSRAQLTGVNAVPGTTIVKAYILGTQNDVIINKTIE